MSSTGDVSEEKRMRKGTRSCRECRRRKIKCTYSSEQELVCNECIQNNRPCARQGHVVESAVSKRANLKIRISKLESIIERLSKDHPQKAMEVICETGSSSTISSANGRQPPCNGDATILEQLKEVKSPLFELFDNDVLRRSSVSTAPPDTSSVINFGSENLSDREKLLTTIADEPNILDVLDIGGAWWAAWEDQQPGKKDMMVHRTLRDSVSIQLADTDPVVVATGLLCIAACLQQVRPGIDDDGLHLSSTPPLLLERISVAVDQVVFSNDVYVETLRGIQALILKAKQHAECNQLRKSWLRIRQAIRTAQKIDVATPLPGMPPAEILSRQRFMGKMFEIDRFMSLLLGLPYAIDDNFTDKLANRILLDNPDIVARMRALRRIVAISAGYINDRNASSDPASVSKTASIQQTLDKAAASLPASWWDITIQSESADVPVAKHEHLMCQLWFYQIQCFLQLPLMLKAASDPAYEEGRTICLNSCRKLVQIFNVLRQNASLSAYTCRCEDFQGLLGAIVLLVGLLQYASQDLEPTGSSFDNDLDLIDITKDTFRYSAQQQGGAIAKQGLHVLVTLSAFLQDDTSDVMRRPDKPKKANLFVPYFGTISVQSGPSYRPKKLRGRSDRGNERLSNSWPDAFRTPATLDGSTVYEPPDSVASSGDTSSIPNAVDMDADGWNSIHGSPDEMSQQDGAVDESGFAAPIFDWDKMLVGTELEQDWNYFSLSTAASR